MSVEELRKIAKEEASKFIMENLNSAIIFTYIQNLEKEIENLKQLMAHKNAYTKKLEEDLYENASNYVVSKDKIRERIKELEGQEDWYIENKSLDDLYGRIDELKELLEEE